MGNIFNEHTKLTEHEEALIQQIINVRHTGFIQQVKSARPQLQQNENEWKEAQIYTAYQALDIGLIDKIGSPIDAIKQLEPKKALGEINMIFRSLSKPEA